MTHDHDVFISSAPGSSNRAEALFVWLEGRGLRCFVSLRDMPPGAKWADIIPATIKGARVFLPVFADGVKNAGPVYEEISLAIEAGRPVVPFRLAPPGPDSGYGNDWQSLNWRIAFPEPSRVFGRVTRIVEKILLKNPYPPAEFGGMPGMPPPPPPLSLQGRLLKYVPVLLGAFAIFAAVPLIRSGSLSTWRQDWGVFLSTSTKALDSGSRQLELPPNANRRQPARDSRDARDARQDGASSRSRTPSPPTQPAPLPFTPGSNSQYAAPAAPPPATTTTAPAAPAAAAAAAQQAAIVRVSGVLSPHSETTVYSDASGLVIEVYANVGDRVTKDRPLAKMDTALIAKKITENRERIKNLEGRIATAERRLEISTDHVERNKQRLADTGGLSPSKLEIENGQAAQERDKAALDLIKASAEEARVGLENALQESKRAMLVCPIDGVVFSRACEPGQQASASNPVSFLIAAPATRLRLVGSVSERDVFRVKNGQPVTFSVLEIPGKMFSGKVLKVEHAPVKGTNPVAYRVEIEAQNPAETLRFGMVASAEIQTPEM
jgi:multidrug efflux pump subunit AcrA (membrane-fusion protein)